MLLLHGSGTRPSSAVPRGPSRSPSAGHLTGPQGAGGTRAGQATVGHDTSGPITDDTMTRLDERLQVGMQEAESGRARLRKRIVIEQVS